MNLFVFGDDTLHWRLSISTEMRDVLIMIFLPRMKSEKSEATNKKDGQVNPVHSSMMRPERIRSAVFAFWRNSYAASFKAIFSISNVPSGLAVMRVI